MILNRFSKDVDTLDKIVYTFIDVTDYIVKCTITVIVVVISCPLVLVVALLSLYVLVRLRRINLHCTRDTYRLKAGLMSPINSLIQDSINGLATIKAFQQESYFLHKLFDLCDTQTAAHVTSSSVNRWTAFRIDLQAYLIATVFSFFSLFVVNVGTPEKLAMVAIGFQLAVEIARHFNAAVRWTATVEIDMINIKRLLQYVVLKPEQEHRQADDRKRLTGAIEFRDVEMRYSKKLQPALRDLSFSVERGQKIAVVGRTGSGKSSLFQLLQGFRPPHKGQISLDGNDITSLELGILRRQLSVVLQQAFIISSYSIHDNLDPEHKRSETEINYAL